MSRGLGKVQQQIMIILNKALEKPGKLDGWVYNTLLAEKLEKSPRQTLTALASLESRGLIETRMLGGWGKAARALLPDGSSAPSPMEELAVKSRRKAHEERAALFAAVDEVIARQSFFTTEDVSRVYEKNTGKFPGTKLSGVIATYLRERRIEVEGTYRDILYREKKRYYALRQEPRGYPDFVK